MTMTFRVTGTAFVTKALEEYPEIAEKAAELAVISTSRYGFALAKKRILKQVNLKPSYVDQNLFVEYGTIGGLKSAVIVGRARPTSLARFDANQLYGPSKSGGRRKTGVSVKVKNQRKVIGKGFLMNLKRGNQQGGNVGLAIRLPTGEQIKEKYAQAKPLYKNQNTDVYLLYGPSVQQVFDDVAPEISPDLTAYLDREFTRQFARLKGGK